MLDEPPDPDPDLAVATRLCLSDGKVVAYVNLSALASLLWTFWYLAVKSSRGEDISLTNKGDLPETPGCSPLRYCEITMTGEGPVMGRLHNPIAGFIHWDARVDLSVNRLQAEQGYQELHRLSGVERGKRVEQVELFGRLAFRLVLC